MTCVDGLSGADGVRVGDLDEEALLAHVFPLLPEGGATLLGPGDDAAVVAAPDGRVVVSTDVLVEGRHFRRSWSGGRDVGRRAAAQNLADVAAMGARPTALVVALVVPRDLPVAWVTDLARGLADVCAPHGVGVVGGDLSGGDQVVVAVTVHGDLEGRAPVRRSGARPGDDVVHAGVLGWSAAGLALLDAAGGRHRAGEADGVARLVATFRAPEPPLEAGPAVADAGATAMLDVSDGLLRDAGRLARSSGVVLDLGRALLAPAVEPLADPAASLAVDPWTWLLAGGEDHGLLATLPAGTDLPVGFRRVGRVRAPDAGEEPGVLLDGEVVAGVPGWDHFGGQSRR